MNWLNIELSTLRSNEYLGSDPIQRATWLNLMAYCADQENGGIITDCASWGDRKWMQLVGVSKSEVHDHCDLWVFDNDAVVVWSYPCAKEIEVRAKREAGKKGGRPKKDGTKKPSGSDVEKPHGSDLLERKGKEGKGKEEEMNSKFTPPASDEVSAYMTSRGKFSNPKSEAEKFCDFYASKGWMVGKNKMKDWMAAVRNWEKGNSSIGASKPQPSTFRGF